MEQVWNQIQDQDERITEIFRREEIDDIETFMALNEQDFKRLNMTTKMIKLIIKIQEQQCANYEPEEWIEEEIVLNTSRNGNGIPAIEHEDPNNPYIGIDLDQIINIDIVFGRTKKGVAIMEKLKENARPDESFIRKITSLLCNCLRSLFGCRPSCFYKDQIATSLVRTYPKLAARSGDVPQALWFHLHSRGINHHAGRIHYHMEYMARISGERVVKRRRIADPLLPNTETTLDGTLDNSEHENLQELILEMKTIVPNHQSKTRIFELWAKTFGNRQLSREQGDFYEHVMEYPAFTAFNGELITNDFRKLKPSANTFVDKWIPIESKILTQFNYLFKEVNNDFVRALAIVRQKHPSRGSKKIKQDNASRENPLKGLVEWIEAEDNFTYQNTMLPVLFVRGPFLEDSNDCAICWKNLAIPIGLGMREAFEIFIQSFFVFKTAPAPSDKQFFIFFGAMLGVETLSTTGTKFMHELQ